MVELKKALYIDIEFFENVTGATVQHNFLQISLMHFQKIEISLKWKILTVICTKNCHRGHEGRVS